MRYRVEQLAAACDVSVDTIRYYQSRGLVPAPAREGRVAWYDDRHAERIRQVRTLRSRGLTLAAIEGVLGNGADPADADLAIAVAAARGESDQDELLTLDEFADRSGVPASLIQAKFEGTPAYIAVFAESPGAGQPPDHVVVWVVSSSDCRILSTASQRVTPA